MSQIAAMRPAKRDLVIDSVEAAGVDVSDWSNFSGGPSKAATNPKYCYEWAFVEPGKVVVLNLWHELLREEEGTIFQELNLLQTARNLSAAGGSSVQIRRAKAADEAIRTAFEELIPVRVIINDGVRRKERVRGASRVRARQLDPEEWHVGAYDHISGNAVLVRGPRGSRYVDQFSTKQGVGGPVPTREVTGQVFVRDAKVRNAALTRAGGRCEFCREPGFSMPNGAVYLETHHVIPLFEGGPDVESNVIALCPNHHKQAHFGVDRQELRKTFLHILTPGG